MTTYAIGDVRGDLQTLQQLLEKIQFDKAQDTLWFTGNLVNSGPDSLGVLRFVKDLGKNAVTVLGDQELRLLGSAEETIQPNDDFKDILNAPDRDDLLKWLIQRPLLHNDANFILVHAGIPAEWSLSQAQTLAMEAESSLTMLDRKAFFENIFADDPTRWHAKHRGWKRLRYIINAFTRMHYCNEMGRLDFSAISPVDTPPDGYIPWYRKADRATANRNIIFGHRPLDGPNLPGIFPLDTGCSNGGTLSALKISSAPELISVSCT
jgi:bis(5'-nucleosyl)-tetraphosphatase (symmetrical)